MSRVTPGDDPGVSRQRALRKVGAFAITYEVLTSNIKEEISMNRYALLAAAALFDELRTFRPNRESAEHRGQASLHWASRTI